MTWQDWCDLVKRHDFSFAFSEDPDVYNRGFTERLALRTAAKQFPRNQVERFWNEQADRQIAAPWCEQFHWAA